MSHMVRGRPQTRTPRTDWAHPKPLGGSQPTPPRRRGVSLSLRSASPPPEFRRLQTQPRNPGPSHSDPTGPSRIRRVAEHIPLGRLPNAGWRTAYGDQ
eukprot:2457448-Alexandrium_andersonii.AAC.1